MVRQSMITVALLHKFVYEFRGNNTYISLDRTALPITVFGHEMSFFPFNNKRASLIVVTIRLNNCIGQWINILVIVVGFPDTIELIRFDQIL